MTCLNNKQKGMILILIKEKLKEEDLYKKTKEELEQLMYEIQWNKSV